MSTPETRDWPNRYLQIKHLSNWIIQTLYTDINRFLATKDEDDIVNIWPIISRMNSRWEEIFNCDIKYYIYQ